MFPTIVEILQGLSLKAVMSILCLHDERKLQINYTLYEIESAGEKILILHNFRFILPSSVKVCKQLSIRNHFQCLRHHVTSVKPSRDVSK